jgi:hypothetical protein
MGIASLSGDSSDQRMMGEARVFTFVNSDWTQVGPDIEGRTTRDQFGSAVDINYDGTVVAAGGPFNERNGYDAGHVRMYELVGGVWKAKRRDMERAAAGDNFGYAISLAENGLIIAVGARERLDTLDGARQGYVQVFDFFFV